MIFFFDYTSFVRDSFLPFGYFLRKKKTFIAKFKLIIG